MSTDTSTGDGGSTGTDIDELRAEVEELREKVADLEADTDDGEQKMSIIATKGTLDMAYPPLILASTAAAFGWNVTIFSTFWALDVFHKDKASSLKLSSAGNPNMPVPNVMAVLPGMDKMTTWMMEKQIDDNDTASVEELVDACIASGVEIQVCQMTQDLMDYEDEDFYDGVTTGVGAASAIDEMADADVQLLV